MITRLRLRNFQNHKLRTLNFDQITTIVGETDKGKSAIIRALRWIIYNRPNGTYFINWDSKSATAEIKIDGQVLTRRKGKVNQYQIGKTKLQAVNRDVPEAVAQLLNVNHNNIQLQHDSLFWFSLTGRALAKELNQIVNLQAIDSTLQRAKSNVTKAKANLTAAQRRHEHAKQEVDEQEWVGDFVKDAKALQDKQTEYKETRRTHAVLRDYVKDVQSIDFVRKNAAQMRTELAKLRRIEAEKDIVGDGYAALRNILDDIQAIDIDSCKRQLRSVQARIKKEKAQAKICPTCGQTLPKE